MSPVSEISFPNWKSTSLVDELDELTCAIYGQRNFSSIDEVRLQKFKKKCATQSADASRNVDFALLPPCKKALVQHIKRVNYQVAIWKRAHEAEPDIPHPCDHGWVEENGTLEPLWFRREELLPEELTELLIESIDAEDLAANEDHEDDHSDDDNDEIVSEESDND